MQVVPVAAVLLSQLDNIELGKLSFHVPVKMGERKKEFQFCWNSFFIRPFLQGHETIFLLLQYYQAEKEVPHPQVLLAFGFLKEKPRLFNPSSQSIIMSCR